MFGLWAIAPGSDEMAFNSDTYRANKHRRQAKENMAKARELKAAGEASRAALYVSIAKSDARLARMYDASAAHRKAASKAVWASQ